MGLCLIGSSSSYDCKCSAPTTNPDPNKYTIMQHRQYDNFLIVKINYHNCNTYEGNKILVYQDCDINRLSQQKIIDPHFSENMNFHSPIARFVPTAKGWCMAVSFVLSILRNQ